MVGKMGLQVLYKDGQMVLRSKLTDVVEEQRWRDLRKNPLGLGMIVG